MSEETHDFFSEIEGLDAPALRKRLRDIYGAIASAELRPDEELRFQLHLIRDVADGMFSRT